MTALPAGGTPVTFEVHAVITAPGTSRPDPTNPTASLVTVAQMGGYYTLTNTSDAPRDVVEPVWFFAYWEVPHGACARFDASLLADLTANHIPIVQVEPGRELCPLAFGDSALDTTPLTLQPHTPAFINILATNMGLRQNEPMRLSTLDADLYVATTTAPPVGWLAVDEELATNVGEPVASTGLPAH